MPNSTPSNNTSKHSSFAGEDFSNNLLSDLAPLLTLFGEQVTKQFLSLSMGWADNILIALGPLGIMTIVVSTIRVSGMTRLKAIIGRARENEATAEAELLSSTSDEVCEMWNGHEIVRTYGRSKTEHLVIVGDNNDGDIRAFTFQDALKKGHLIEKADRDLNIEGNTDFFSSPNLTINAPGSSISKKEQWIWVFLGIVFQIMALVAPVVVVRGVGRWKLSYGYVCYVVDTALIIVGLALCSRIIEGSTTELEFIPNPEKQRSLQVITVQQETNVGEQHFDPFVTVSKPYEPFILVSRRNDREYRILTVVSILLTICGFVSQFTGLRALHWSATLISLGFIIAMTSIRAWIRRGLAVDAKFWSLMRDRERDDLSTWIYEHVRDAGPEQLAGLQLPSYLDAKHKSPAWCFMPPRLLTAVNYETWKNTDAEDFSESSFSSPEIAPLKYLKAANIRRHVVLSASMQKSIQPRQDLIKAADQLISAMVFLTNHILDYGSHLRKRSLGSGKTLTWDLQMVVTSPNLSKCGSDQYINQPLDHPVMAEDHYAKHALVPGKFEMNIKEALGFRGRWSWGMDDEALQQVIAIIDMDECSRLLLAQDRPRGGALRLIGTVPHEGNGQTNSRLAIAYHEWLDSPLILHPSPTTSADCCQTREVLRNTSIYGCRYSSHYLDYTTDKESGQTRQASAGHSSDQVTNVYIRTDQTYLYKAATREIFSIFMLTLTSHVEPLSGEGVFHEEIEMGPFRKARSDKVARHPESEKMVDILLERAPMLVWFRQTARDMLVPAFLYHNLLPQSGLDCANWCKENVRM